MSEARARLVVDQCEMVQEAVCNATHPLTASDKTQNVRPEPAARVFVGCLSHLLALHVLETLELVMEQETVSEPSINPWLST